MTEHMHPQDPADPASAPKPGARATAAHHARRVLSAYTGEHGVYGVVLVTALISIGEHYDTDFEVLIYVVGTMVIFWLAHVYAGVVAASAPGEPRASLGARIGHSAAHSVGMLLAMLLPTLLLALGSLRVLDEWDAYDLASFSGVAVLAVIGWLNATRNGRRWPMRIVGALVTASLGLLVIGLSTLAH